MLPILSKRTLEELDRKTLLGRAIPVAELMEIAGTACMDRIIAHHGSGVGYVVLVGWGNNGGDGLVIARQLHLAGFRVRVIRILIDRIVSGVFTQLLGSAVEAGVRVDEIDESILEFELLDDEVVVDCVLGRGSDRPPRGWLKAFITRVNDHRGPVLAIDQPSGMVSPESGILFDPDACIRADRTLVIELPRLAMFLPGTGPFFGTWELVPIGLDVNVMHDSERIAEWVEKLDVQALLRDRPRFGHKGTFGHACLIAGSKGMFGAAILSTNGCLKSGVGLCTAHVPNCGADVLVQGAPDAMGSFDQDPDVVSRSPDLESFTAIGVGPGLGGSNASRRVVKDLLHRSEVPVVLDADALNAVAADLEWLASCRAPLILTPHSKEMERLLGRKCGTDQERLQAAKGFAVEHQCVVVLKGAYTAICGSDGRIQFNSTGNVGMAKGGSGDVLTGVITGLLAQGYQAEDACVIGVHLHGLAGDLAANELGIDAMRASDLITFLPAAWKQLRKT